MAGGRPIEYTKERRIEIAKEMLQWAKDHPDCLTVPHFTVNNGYSTFTLVEWAKEGGEFSQWYIQAKEQIGINRLNATMFDLETDGRKPLDKSIFLRHVGNFDPDKRAFDREEKEFESSLKQKEAQAATQDDLVRAEKVVEQLDKLQQHFQFGSPPENNQ